MLYGLGVLLFCLAVAAFIAAVGCKLVIIYRMFQNDEVLLPMLCLLLSPCGLGSIIAYLFGWLSVREYDCFYVMVTWTVSMPLFVFFMMLTEMVAPELLQK